MMIDELGSKKWRTMVLTLAATLFEQYQEAPWYVVVSVATVACVYLLAQGMADAGKSRALLYLQAIEKGTIDSSALTREVDAKLTKLDET